MTPADLYDASLEPLRYGIGTVRDDAGNEHAVLAIRYAKWSAAHLHCLREALADGVEISIRSERREIYLQTKARVQIECRQGVHRNVLDAPAWDATLEQTSESVLPDFERLRAERSAFELLVQGSRDEFTARIRRDGSVSGLSPLRPIEQPIPSE